MRYLIYFVLLCTLLFGVDEKVLVQEEGSFVIVEKSTATVNTTPNTSTDPSEPTLPEFALPSRAFNVLDHGLVGDGLTDDSAALNNLARNLDVTNWYFPAGRSFLLSQVTVPSHLKAIYGGGTIISKAYTPRYAPIGAFQFIAPAHITGLLIDGLSFKQQVSSNWPQESANTQWYGHITDLGNAKIDGLEIRNCSFDTKEFKNNGIKIISNPASGGEVIDLNIHHNTFTHIKTFAVEIWSENPNVDLRQFKNAHLHHNDFIGPEGKAISVVQVWGGKGRTGEPDGTETRIYNNTFTNVTWGIEIGGLGVRVYDNVMTGVTEDLIGISSSLAMGAGKNSIYRNKLIGNGSLLAKINLYKTGSGDFYDNLIGCQIHLDDRGSVDGYDYDFYDNNIVYDPSFTPAIHMIKLEGVTRSRFENNTIYAGSSISGQVFYVKKGTNNIGGGIGVAIKGNTVCSNASRPVTVFTNTTGNNIDASGNVLTNNCTQAFPTDIP